MENINLNNYKYFYYVVKSQGYTNASNKIMVSQPSLSYGVKKLEEEIGKKLIDRSCKNFVLTKEGEALFKKLKEVEKLLFNDDVKQKISIGSLRGFADTYLPQIVNIFHKRFPKCQLEIIINESRTLISLFDRNDINILFDKNELTTFNKDVENICLRKSENCFACSKKFYIENEKLLNDINRFSSWPLILPLESKKRRCLDEYFKLNGLVPTNVIMEIPNSNLIKEVIKNCDAVGYFMKESIQKEINAGELVVIDTIKKLPADDVYVIYNKDSNNRFISEFISVCKEYLHV
ncbi:MAG: LysR family transcriptional regulator [Firmicutes bacterium]|nr:LysR family transcriptional regulator [Bacillota bacterium]